MVINPIKVYDFIDPNPECTVTMKKGNDADAAVVVTSTDGVKLDGTANSINRSYTVKVETTESMHFNVAFRDFAGKRPSAEYRLLTVKDVIAPTIELKIENNVYKVGDTVTIAAYGAVDETSSSDAVVVTYYVICPDGSVKYLSETSFKVEVAGKYMVYYIARDEAGNNGFAHYSIIVS